MDSNVQGGSPLVSRAKSEGAAAPLRWITNTKIKIKDDLIHSLRLQLDPLQEETQTYKEKKETNERNEHNFPHVVRRPPGDLRPQRVPRERARKLEIVPEICGENRRRDEERKRV